MAVVLWWYPLIHTCFFVLFYIIVPVGIQATAAAFLLLLWIKWPELYDMQHKFAVYRIAWMQQSWVCYLPTAAAASGRPAQTNMQLSRFQSRTLKQYKRCVVLRMRSSDVRGAHCWNKGMRRCVMKWPLRSQWGKRKRASWLIYPIYCNAMSANCSVGDY